MQFGEFLPSLKAEGVPDLGEIASGVGSIGDLR
jgi:hypothetical protein